MSLPHNLPQTPHQANPQGHRGDAQSSRPASKVSTRRIVVHGVKRDNAGYARLCVDCLDAEGELFDAWREEALSVSLLQLWTRYGSEAVENFKKTYGLTEVDIQIDLSELAPLTPPGTVEANDAMRADLKAERERVKAMMVRDGFGHRESVIYSRKRSKREAAQDELFNSKPHWKNSPSGEEKA